MYYAILEGPDVTLPVTDGRGSMTKKRPYLALLEQVQKVESWYNNRSVGVALPDSVASQL